MGKGNQAADANVKRNKFIALIKSTGQPGKDFMEESLSKAAGTKNKLRQIGQELYFYYIDKTATKAQMKKIVDGIMKGPKTMANFKKLSKEAGVAEKDIDIF